MLVWIIALAILLISLLNRMTIWFRKMAGSLSSNMPTVNLSALAGAGQQFFDNNGSPLTGGKLYSYAAGTTTPQTTYTDAAGSVAHTNPIVLDSSGRVSTGEIWVVAGQNYKFVLKTSSEVTLVTWDNITGINGTGITSNAVNVEYDPAGAGAVATTVQDKLRETVSVKDFGAVGDGVTDDTAAIQSAFTACMEGGTVYFEAGKTYLTDSLSSRTANVVDLNGSTLVRKAPFSTGTLLTLQPTQKNQYTGLSIAVTQNQSFFTLPVGASVELGDLLLFTSLDTSTPYGTDYLHGQYAVVSNIVGSKIYITTPFYDSYTIDSITVYQGKSGITVKNGTLDISLADSVAQSTAGLFIRGSNMEVSNVVVRGNYYTGILTQMLGENGVVENSLFDTCMNTAGIVGGGRTGYGINVIGNNIRVVGCSIKDCKHGYTSASRGTMAIRLSLKDSVIYESETELDVPDYDGAIDYHSNVQGLIEIAGVRVIAQDRWIQTRSNRALYKVSNSTFSCVQDYSQLVTGVETDIYRISFDRCTFNLTSNSKLFQTTATSYVTKINDVAITNCVFNNGLIFNGTIPVENVLIASCVMTQNAVAYFSGGWQNVKIINNHITSACAFKFLAPLSQLSKGLVISNNKIFRTDTTSDAPIEIRSATTDISTNISDVFIESNSIEFIPGDTSPFSGIFFRDVDVNRLIIGNNAIKRGDYTLDAITLRNIGVFQGTIIGNNLSAFLSIYANPTAITLEQFTVVGNTGYEYRVIEGAPGLVTKVQYKFDAGSNNFVTVDDIL